MAAESSEEKKDNQPAPSEEARRTTRRNLFKAGLTLSIVFLVGGAVSAAKSLFSPANPPTPAEAQTTTPTVTETVTVTQASSQSTSSSESSSSSTSSTATTSSPFPQVMVANISDLVVSQPVYFNYPLQETPNILVKLGVKATGGVGPDGDIVAFSQVCQHLGCIWAFVAPKTAPACDSSYSDALPSGYCCCHGSVYDVTAAGAVVSGPAPRPVPQVTLQVDSSGNIYAIGMGPPTIFGHNTGSDDVLYDLQGGTLV